jgi:hypothetical protein
MQVNLPPKPRFGTACNGCGICCKLSLCELAQIAFPGAQEPCPALKIAPDGRSTYCELAATEAANRMPPLIQTILGVGYGCSMTDDDTTDEQIQEHQTKWEGMARKQRKEHETHSSPQPASP